jgi:hypothetical protein
MKWSNGHCGNKHIETTHSARNWVYTYFSIFLFGSSKQELKTGKKEYAPPACDQ